jgi:hypothetical protein
VASEAVHSACVWSANKHAARSKRLEHFEFHSGEHAAPASEKSPFLARASGSQENQIEIENALGGGTEHFFADGSKLAKTFRTAALKSWFLRRWPHGYTRNHGTLNLPGSAG